MITSSMRRTVLAAGAALAVLSLPLAGPAVAAGPVLLSGTAGETVSLPVSQALAALPVQEEDRTGYERTKFRHWIDADGDGCNTRQEILKRDALTAPAQGPGCTLTGGTWFSPYDDTYFDDAHKLDVDHMVPLAEAWDSGASSWTARERQDYANDLGDARDLIAVSAKSNRSKADKDPSDWLPPAVGFRCTYVTDWIADKARWGLDIDTAEQAALTRTLADCPDTVITVTTAR